MKSSQLLTPSTWWKNGPQVHLTMVRPLDGCSKHRRVWQPGKWPNYSTFQNFRNFRKKWYFIRFIHKVIFEDLILLYFECRPNFQSLKDSITYCKVVSSNTSRLEAHAGFFRLLMKEIFGPNVL